jgi:hypothetical protein
MTTKTTTASKPQPPAAAVAADAHWAAKMERLRNRSLAEATYVVCDDEAIRTQYRRTQRTLDLAQTYADTHPDDADAKSDLAKAATDLDEAKQAYDEIAIPIRFRALPRPAMEALYKAHKPSEAEAEEGASWADTFPAALIAASSIDGMTETEAQELLSTWSLAEANDLFQTVHNLQNTTRADLGKG